MVEVGRERGRSLGEKEVEEETGELSFVRKEITKMLLRAGCNQPALVIGIRAVSPPSRL